MTDNIIDLKGLSKDFDGTEALDINLSIRQNEF